jgi:hypothetical protein
MPEKMIRAYNVPYDWQNGAVQMAESYYQLGDSAKTDEMMKTLADKAVEYLTWYLSNGRQPLRDLYPRI